MHSCLYGIRRDALGCSRVTLNSMYTMLVSNAGTAQILLSKGFGMPTKETPSMDPERLRAG